MNVPMLVAQAARRAEDGLSFTDVVRDIPHDPASFVVYALVIGSIALVIRAGRKGPSRPDGSTG